MTKNRLEAFSDGVIAIIITIMVLELKVPSGTDLAALLPLCPTFICYTLSFVFVAIYWNNHHHMLHAAHRVNGASLWANMGLLFCLSLIPFSTAWMGENNFHSTPVALYGINLFACAIAYYILARTLITANGEDSPIAVALGKDRKGMISLALYSSAIALSFVAEMASFVLYVSVAVIWLIPDKRIERALQS